ncbi:hypothetical protein Aam_055_028 [Acidocella aminolytica 101 = DSM 11237]|uniref:Uncharacterized protein n=1 Tax=Acidocella aminolytica 101 = DSM 11237 TaxID=1120923 RepID=A0A0D6PHH2_9PROT|nr:hypothetical protein Aam_055_028 [Acidocella aminolytica 101 = DSM 11237]GBQ40236.1 hypothetical protein AA11237_2304 [Acidocella aminolytica 101 = DSM 11237]
MSSAPMAARYKAANQTIGKPSNATLAAPGRRQPKRDRDLDRLIAPAL